MEQFKQAAIVILALTFSGYTHASFMPPVEVDSREWLQVSDFTSLSWNDVSAVCDQYTGECAGSLSGGSLDGWTWAAWADVVELIEGFISDSDDIGDIDESIRLIFSAFQPTYSSSNPGEYSLDLFGKTRTLNADGQVTTAHVWYSDSFEYVDAGYNTGAPFYNAPDASRTHIGHFFYRDPLAVPLPATGLLTLLGLAGLFIRRSH